MTTTSSLTRSLISYTLQTRTYGHTYVHSAVRASIGFCWEHEQNGVRFRVTGYGRSLQSRGHKYKVYANDAQTGKPVRTKELIKIFA
jgi:hypothetical protein